MKIKDCMCNDVCCVNANTKISEVANLMSTNHIGCVPVCDDNNKICGIVTDRDILLRCVACDKDNKTTPVSDVMTCNVCTCTENEEISNAEMKMSKNQIRRLPICDENNHVIGMLTLGDLAQNCDEIGKQNVCNTIQNICDTSNTKNAE